VEVLESRLRDYRFHCACVPELRPMVSHPSTGVKHRAKQLIKLCVAQVIKQGYGRVTKTDNPLFFNLLTVYCVVEMGGGAPRL